MREDRQAGRTEVARATSPRKRNASRVRVAIVIVCRTPPLGSCPFIDASEHLRLVGPEAHPTSPLVLARRLPRSVLAPLPVQHPLGSIDTESLCERNTESIYAVVN